MNYRGELTVFCMALYSAFLKKKKLLMVFIMIIVYLKFHVN